jgi:hypothetical protein
MMIMQVSGGTAAEQATESPFRRRMHPLSTSIRFSSVGLSDHLDRILRTILSYYYYKPVAATCTTLSLPGK